MATPWDRFFNDCLKTITASSQLIIDIGGGLRISKQRGNVYDARREHLREWLKECDYKILDPVDTYHPDIVGDIHALPFKEQEVDAFICLAVLEHVKDPHTGVREMHRCLKREGYCFAYVPFLFAYHAEEAYYQDYYRFTHEGVRELFAPFSSVDVVPVRGPLETISHLLPGIFGKACRYPARCIDVMLKKQTSRQTSGFYVLARK